MTKNIGIPYNKKLCECGKCDEIIFKYDKRGRPRRFVFGHHTRGIYNNNYGRKGSLSFGWKGGIKKDKDGYLYEYCPDHPFANRDGYVFQHRLVYERYYNCILLPYTSIHHINAIKNDNRIENLEPYYHSQHSQMHKKKDLTDRFCFLCKSIKTYVDKKGYTVWFKHPNGFLCQKCYANKYTPSKRTKESFQRF